MTNTDELRADQYAPDEFDFGSLLQSLDNDRSLVAEVIGIFIGDVQMRIERLENALLAGDMETVRDEAHTIKGSAATIMAIHIRQAAELIEEKVSKGGSPDEAVSELKRCFSRFKHRVTAEKMLPDFFSGNI